MASFQPAVSASSSLHPGSVGQLTVNDETLLGCETYSYMNIPPDLFVDVYELENYAPFYAFEHLGTKNLELPVFAVDSNGSQLLLHLFNAEHSPNLTIHVPLHTRYGVPATSRSTTHNVVTLPNPQVFFLCPNEERFQHLHASKLPFTLPDSFTQWLGWEGSSIHPDKKLVLPTTLQPPSPNVVHVPVGTTQDSPFVMFGTSLVIIAMFLFVGREIIRTAIRLRHTPLKPRKSD